MTAPLKPREVQTSYLRDHSVIALKVTCALIGTHVRPFFYTIRSCDYHYDIIF